MQDLEPAQREQLKNIAALIQALTQHPGWAHFVNAVETVIEAELPRTPEIKNADAAVSMASKVVYVAGLRRALQIPEQYREILRSLEELGSFGG